MTKFVTLFLLFAVCMAMASAKVVVLNPENIDSKLSEGNWFVEFYAPWCGFCQRLEPIWEELGKAMEGEKVNIAKVNCEQHRMLGRRFGVEGYPTLIMFSNGKMYGFDGDRDLETLKKFALGGFETGESQSIPTGNNFWDPVMDAAETVVLDMIDLYETSFVSMCIIAGLGVIVSLVISLFVIPFFVGYKPSFIIPRTIYLQKVPGQRPLMVDPTKVKMKKD